jgi:hypothetical protein
MHNGYPFTHEHSYQSVSVTLEDSTFTARHCEKCNEHKVVSFLKKLFKV